MKIAQRFSTRVFLFPRFKSETLEPARVTLPTNRETLMLAAMKYRRGAGKQEAQESLAKRTVCDGCGSYSVARAGGVECTYLICIAESSKRRGNYDPAAGAITIPCLLVSRHYSSKY